MVKYKYPCSQAILYLILYRLWQMCRDNQADFFAFDPKFTMAFIDKNIARIKFTEDLPDFKARKEDISLLSVEFDQISTDVVVLGSLLKNSVQRAYRNNKDIEKVMLTTAGFDDFAKVKRFNDKAIAAFLSSALKFIDDKADVLRDAGKLPDDFAKRLTTVDTLFDSVQARYSTAEDAAKAKKDEKIAANNDIFDEGNELLGDARFMYQETPDRVKQYEFNTIWDLVEPTKNAGVKGKTLAVGGKVSVPSVTVKELLTGKTDFSDKEGSYEITPLSEGKYTLTFSAEGYVTQTIDIVIKTGMTKRLNVEMVVVATNA